MTKPINSFPEYRQGLYDRLIALGDRRFAEQTLARKIESSFANDPAFSRKERISLLGKAEKMRSCRTAGFHGLRNGKLVTAWTSKCGQVRLCPDEARAEGARLGDAYLPEMKGLMLLPDMRCFYVVLTTPNAPLGALRAEKRAQFARWKKLHDLSRKGLLDIGGGTIEGVFLAQEDPLSAHDDWNVHINGLFFIRGKFDYDKFRALWGNNVEFKLVPRAGLEKALLEVIKYSVKHITASDDGAPGLVDFDSAAFAEWWKAGIRFRRVRSYGALNGISSDDGDDDEEVSPADRETQWMGHIRWGAKSLQYTTTWKIQPGKCQPTDESGELPNVDLILVDKCGKPALARPAGLFGGSAEEEIPSMDRTEIAAEHSPSADASGGSTWASTERLSTVAQPLPLTAKHKNSLSVSGIGGFIPIPDADSRARLRLSALALEREEKRFALQKHLHSDFFEKVT